MPTKDEVARELAALHFAIEESVTQIFRLRGSAEAESSPAEPIKLLEVNADTPPAGVIPLQFGPAPSHGIHYPSVIVEVTPDEFDRIRSAELALPKGWVIGEELPKPAGV